jgi:hypothetical protein
VGFMLWLWFLVWMVAQGRGFRVGRVISGTKRHTGCLKATRKQHKGRV